MNATDTDHALPDDVVALVPMRNVVLFPHVLLPVTVGRAKSIAAVAHAVHRDVELGVVLQRDPAADDPARDALHDIGTLATVMRVVVADDGLHHVVCQGHQRFRVLDLIDGLPFLAARIQRIDRRSEPGPHDDALGIELRERALELLAHLPGVPGELSHALRSARSPAQLADLAAGLAEVEIGERQRLLETPVLEQRLRIALGMLTRRLQAFRLSQEMGERTRVQIDDRQREYLLREQLKTIQKELGEDDDRGEEIARLDQAIAAAAMPAEVEAHVRKDLKRLRRMNESSGEGQILRTWLEWMTELPWREPEPLAIDLAAARATLAAEHFGLETVKRRIVEFLAVKKLNPRGRAPILCFAGPPGVGKTSLGQSIARALQRPFARVALGGVHDEAEIRGHRRTYIGAMPGTIVQALRKAGARDGVLLLDEVDKMSAGIHGDPSAALLEVLDPEQNATFRDNYLGVPFDLSRVVFVCTANVIDEVPGPVRDRMELIELPGYTREEKLQIAATHLLPRQREINGLQAGQCEIDGEALGAIVADYTREAGVRQLEREIGRVMRHAAMAVAETPDSVVRIGAGDLAAILGPAKYEHEVALRSSVPGVATGLAWTPVGGDILFIEATRVPGRGKLILTGQLGDVMKESAQAALTLVKSRADGLGIAPAIFDGSDVHVHVPAGAIPKDGPSAGVAMFMALASLCTGRAVRHDVAMTGEISLRGLVLPVGGIKEKVLAAQRAGLSQVLLPARNGKDLAEVPASVRESMRFVALETVDDAVAAALGPA